MAMARYSCLCIDSADATASAAFWAEALGLQRGYSGPDGIRLDGLGPRHGVWVNAVPEAHSVKNRLHIDVNTESVDRLVAAGAGVLDAESFPWTVLADPDGGELCAFVREGRIHHRLYELVLDCLDPASQARWWRGALGGSIGQDDEQTMWWLDGIDGAPFESIVFVEAAEPKIAKNRVHIDVEARPDELLAHGARFLHQGARWQVLTDPEGNEFCAFPSV